MARTQGNFRAMIMLPRNLPTPPSLLDYGSVVKRYASTLKPLPKRPVGQPLLSVITVCRNAASTLPATLHSISAQSYPWIEHIVIDGASTDGTVDILRSSALLAGWVSERDDGISDAFNKGIALSRGELIAIVNADDVWLPDTATLSVAALQQEPDATWSFGGCNFTLNGQVVLHQDGDPRYSEKIHRWMPALNHPTVVMRRSAYESFGMFRLDLRIAMDYDLLLRFHRAGLVGTCIPKTLASMALGGASNGLNVLRSHREASQVAILHGRNPIHAQVDCLCRSALPFLRQIAIMAGVQRPWRIIKSKIML
jgi:GT2 family glycosyltransferase